MVNKADRSPPRSPSIFHLEKEEEGRRKKKEYENKTFSQPSKSSCPIVYTHHLL